MNTKAHAPLRFSKPLVLRPEQEAFRLEILMLDYIKTKTKFLTQNPFVPVSLLKKYIELYVANPAKYPLQPENPVHCIVHEAGDAVLDQSALPPPHPALRATLSRKTGERN